MADRSANPDTLPPGTLLGGHEIVRRLGHGGMGVVYEAVQLSLRRRVALKVLAPRLAGKSRFVARFDRETFSLANLSHAHIVAIYDRGVDGDVFYFTMEFVAGESLRDRIRRGALPLSEACRIADEILSALEHAHERGVVHRDVKPENVLLDGKGQVKVADFGIAHLDRSETPEGGEAGSAGKNLTVGTIGTPKYMAPEQRARRTSDHRADLYAAGVVFFEMLTGRLPKNEAEALSSLPDSVSAPVGRFLWRLLAQDPRDRYPSAAAAREALVEARSAAPPAGAVPSGLRPSGSAGAGWRWSAAAAAGACILAVAWAFGPGSSRTAGPASVRPVTAAGGAVRPANSAPGGPVSTPTSPGGGGPPPSTGVRPAVSGGATDPGTRPAVPDAGTGVRAEWEETGRRFSAGLERAEWHAATALLAGFRSRHERELRAEPELSEALAEAGRALAQAARRDFESKQAEATRLREQGRYAEALRAVEHPGGFGLPDLDDAARESLARTRRVAGDAGQARARELRDAGQWRAALSAFREALEFAQDPERVVALNGEIAALKRAVRAGIPEALERLEFFVRNGRFDYPEDLARAEKDPERAELASFLRIVRDDLEAFRGGRTVPRDLLATWHLQLERTPVTLGDRAGVGADERCPRCEGMGGDACATCSGGGSVRGVCPDCRGARTGVCPKCSGRRDAKCESCVGKGTVPKRVRVKCQTCAPKRCPDCRGTGFGIGYGMCGPCGGDGQIGTAGRVGGKMCPDCKGAKTILITDHVPCPACDKKGARPCTHCRGTGISKCLRCDASGEVAMPCPDCAGAGDRPCLSCKGSGRRAGPGR